MDRLLEVIERAKPLTDSVIVSFSCGKDSAVLLDLCRQYFKRVEAFHMYLVPGLSFHEAYMAAMEDRYDVKIRRLPSWLLSNMLRGASLRPHTAVTMSTAKLTLPDVWTYVRKETGVDWIADGSKAADSFTRRQMLIGWKGIYRKAGEPGGRVYPMAQWSNKTIAHYMAARRIPYSPEYRFLKHSFSSLEAQQLIVIEREFPNDYRRILARFPQAEAVVAVSGSARPGGSDLESFKTMVVHRNRVRKAPYNPRQLDPAARRKLLKIIKKHGFVEPPVWNERTGNLVGGHQRLSIRDELEGTDDYTLTVAVVDVDERQEKALNVALNNPSAQGQYDLTALQSLVSEDGVQFEDMGFDKLDVSMLFADGDRLQSMFSDEGDSAKGDIEQIGKMSKMSSEQAALKRVEVAASQLKHKTNDDDAEFYAVFVANSRADLDAFLKRFGLPETERYQSLTALVDAIDDATGVPTVKRVDHAAAVANRQAE